MYYKNVKNLTYFLGKIYDKRDDIDIFPNFDGEKICGKKNTNNYLCKKVVTKIKNKNSLLGAIYAQFGW